MTQDEKALAPQSETQPLARLSDIDFQEFFGFKEKEIKLDDSEAWILNGRVMHFGKGSRRIATQLGVEFLMPEKIHIDGTWHSNPHIVWKDGKAVGVYILKHGIAIAPEGIRYLQPNLDYVDLNAVVAAMAMNTFDEVRKTSADGAKNCSRDIFEKMRKSWKKPGDPDWFFIPTLDDSTGIAFNQNEKGDAGDAIRKLQSSMVMMRRSPLRKLQTATDRLVLEKLFPETVSSYVEGSMVKCDKYGNLNPKDPKYLKWIKSAKFKINVPTKAPVARTLLMELGIALRDNDAESRERKFGHIMSVLGGAIDVKELPPGELQAEDIEPDAHNMTRVESTNDLKAIPTGLDLRGFKKWMKTEYLNLTEGQQGEFFAKSGCKDQNNWNISKDNWQDLYALIMDWAGIAPPESDGEVTADDMRKHMLDWIMDQDGNMRFLGPILKEYGHSEDTNFTLIPEDQIKGIYSKFIGQMKREQSENVPD